MTATRRDFLAGALAGGGALSLAVTFGCGGERARIVNHVKATGELRPNMYVTVKPDGRIALALNKTELGQGVATGYATLAAEELGVPLDRIDVYFADSKPEYRTSFMMHQTGGSTSTVEGYLPIRRAAASAREMLVAAAAAGWRVPTRECSVVDGRVVHAASGRSAGFGELTHAAAREDVPDDPRLVKPAEYKLVGKSGRRIDGKSKVDGSARYGIDVSVAGMVNAIVLRPPAFGARARTVRADAARAMRGVIDVFAIPTGVAVVADKHWQALAAGRAVEVDWGDGSLDGLDTEQMRTAAAEYRESGSSALRNDGNADKAIGRSATKVEALYEVPYLAHAPMEPQNCTVHVTGDGAEVWVPCQSPTLVQGFVGEVLGCSREDVLVHTTLAGGGFGRRFAPDFAAEAARIAKRVKRPVKLIWSREDDMTQGFYRPQSSIRMRGGLDRDGKVRGIAAHTIGQSIALDSGGTMRAAMPGIPHALKNVIINSMLAMVDSGSVPDFFSVEGLIDSPYRVDDFRVEFTPVRTRLPVTSWRSVGHSFTAFAIESFVDECAHAAKQDPLAFRRAHLPASSRQRRVLDAVADLAKWGTPAGANIGRGIARHLAFDTEVAEVADVEVVDGRIRVRRVWCVVDCGLAINPDVIRAQMEGAIIFGLSAALDQEITVKRGIIQQTNFDTFPALRMFECPEIVVKVLDSTASPTGVGEPGLPPIAPAVANAIFAATGVRLRRMPLQRAWNERGGRS